MISAVIFESIPKIISTIGPAVLWGTVVLASIIVEAVTVSLVSIWFVPGAIIAMILALCKVTFWVELVVFAVISAGCLILSRTVFKKFLKMSTKPVATNVNAVIGKTGCVCEKIDNAKSAGAVKVDGQIWTARSTDDNITIDEGALVTVISVSGVKLICEIKK